MKRSLSEMLICPSCLPEEKMLRLEVLETCGDEIERGLLRCPKCAFSYPVEQGIPNLLPQGTEAGSSFRYNTSRVTSEYLWSQYADIMGDADCSSAYTKWSGLMASSTGIAIDMGCAVGRFTFEAGQHCDLSIGLDNSAEFIRAARELQKSGQVTFPLLEEGHISRSVRLSLPSGWDRQKVEFIIADALSPPFPSSIFSAGASLNLVDRVPEPLRHLRELSRVMKTSQSQLLISDPFSWSEEIVAESDWLGGSLSGELKGYGIDNIRSLLEGKFGGLAPPWQVVAEGNVWWKIRLHRNKFELIRSCYIVAHR